MAPTRLPAHRVWRVSAAAAVVAAMLPAAFGGGACSSTPTKADKADGAVVAQPACGSKADPTCPSVPPSYARDIQPILDARCNGCHVGGTGKPWPLTTYQDAVDWRVQLLGDLLGCTMPPADAGQQLSADERSQLIGWLACKTPNN